MASNENREQSTRRACGNCGGEGAYIHREGDLIQCDICEGEGYLEHKPEEDPCPMCALTPGVVRSMGRLFPCPMCEGTSGVTAGATLESFETDRERAANDSKKRHKRIARSFISGVRQRQASRERARNARLEQE